MFVPVLLVPLVGAVRFEKKIPVWRNASLGH